MNEQARAVANRKLAWRLMWVVGGAILFAVAMVPLYNVLCQLTGFNGKTDARAVGGQLPAKVDTSRWITVEFTTSVMPGLGWNFAPTIGQMRVRPGQIEMATFIAKNNTNQEMVGQAVPSVSPGQASLYFKKIECFCFQRQALKPGESREMPLRFYISPDLPDKVQAVTLSYAFFKAVPTAK